MVGRKIFIILNFLGKVGRIKRMLVVVCVFALIWLEDSFCGLFVLPEKLSVKFMPKKRPLFNKRQLKTQFLTVSAISLHRKIGADEILSSYVQIRTSI